MPSLTVRTHDAATWFQIQRDIAARLTCRFRRTYPELGEVGEKNAICGHRLIVRVRLQLRELDMARQLLLSGVISVGNIVIHALAMVAIVRISHIVSERNVLQGTARLIAIMIGTVSVLMVTHISEVIVWSVTYSITEAAPPGTNLLYFAFVNYTTLGYGDVLPVDRWRLIGPMTAMNGVLLFGWSTAVIFEILRRTIVHDTSQIANWHS